TGRMPVGADEIADLARGAMFLPAIGLALGLAVGAIAAAAAARAPALAIAPAAVALLVAVQRAAPAAATVDAIASLRGEPGGVVVALASLAVAAALATEAVAIALVGGPALALAVGLAVMLGRWASVVHAYGSLPAPDDPFAAALVGGVEFREFAIASVSAMALALGLANAVGVVLVVTAAAVAIALRIALHRARGGVTRASIVASGLAAETATLVAAAAVARLLAG